MTQTPLSNRLERKNKDAIDRLSERASYLTPEALWEQAVRNGEGDSGPGGCSGGEHGEVYGPFPQG